MSLIDKAVELNDKRLELSLPMFNPTKDDLIKAHKLELKLKLITNQIENSNIRKKRNEILDNVSYNKQIIE